MLRALVREYGCTWGKLLKLFWLLRSAVEYSDAWYNHLLRSSVPEIAWNAPRQIASCTWLLGIGSVMLVL